MLVLLVRWVRISECVLCAYHREEEEDCDQQLLMSKLESRKHVEDTQDRTRSASVIPAANEEEFKKAKKKKRWSLFSSGKSNK